jgi:multicomponent Na+:H+ antiporter subunit D
MMSLSANWLAAPIVIPALTAALSFLFNRLGNARAVGWQYLLALLGALANLAVGITLLTITLGGQRVVLQMGTYPAPFGISFVADGLSATMLTLTGILAFATILYARGTLDQRDRLNFYPLALLLVMGVNGAFLAGDIFNLYVFFEVLLMASFALLTLGGQISQINGSIRYVLLNLLASTIFLSTAGVIYGTLGTLNMAHLAERMPSMPASVQFLIAGLLLIAYSSKASLFPLFFWLPSSYHTPHPAVTAFFGGILTKVGIYTLFRIFPLLFPTLLQDWQPLILAIAGLTMVTGVFAAMAVNTVRRVLSAHIISQVGYMVMGLGLAASPDPTVASFGLAAGILYLVNHMLVKTALMMAGGAAEIIAGSGSLLRQRLAGLLPLAPTLSVLFLIAALSLAGIPPSSGFVSKLMLLQSAVGSQHWLIAATSVTVSFFTLMSMIRLWQKGFWGYANLEAATHHPLATQQRMGLALAPIVLLLTLSLGIGLFNGPVVSWAETAAAQVLDRAGYIAAVAPTETIEMQGSAAHDH